MRIHLQATEQGSLILGFDDGGTAVFNASGDIARSLAARIGVPGAHYYEGGDPPECHSSGNGLPPELTPMLLMNAATCCDGRIEVDGNARQKIIDKLLAVARWLQANPVHEREPGRDSDTLREALERSMTYLYAARNAAPEGGDWREGLELRIAANRKALSEGSNRGNAPGVTAYVNCAKHRGMSYTFTAHAAPVVVRTVCPICEPPMTDAKGGV